MYPERDKDSFLQLIKKHERIIYKLIHLYANDQAEVEDMYQETLYQAWKSWESYRGDAVFSTWLYRICLNTLLTLQRKQRPKLVFGTEHWEPPVSAGENDEVKALYTAIRTLHETDRALISLYLEGFSNKEIATMIGISPNNVAVKLHRIREQLQKTLTSKQYGY